jgi:uncharacterized protein
MKCPVCDVELVMSERQGIEIDYCPKCRGVWLDRGELDKIIERSVPSSSEIRQRETSHAPEQHHHHDDHYKHQYGYKRKKSLLEQLFD